MLPFIMGGLWVDGGPMAIQNEHDGGADRRIRSTEPL
jgi:hypothetical protein